MGAPFAHFGFFQSLFTALLFRPLLKQFYWDPGATIIGSCFKLWHRRIWTLSTFIIVKNDAIHIVISNASPNAFGTDFPCRIIGGITSRTKGHSTAKDTQCLNLGTPETYNLNSSCPRKKHGGRWFWEGLQWRKSNPPQGLLGKFAIQHIESQ